MFFLEPDMLSSVFVRFHNVLELRVMEGSQLLYSNDSDILYIEYILHFFLATFSFKEHYSRLDLLNKPPSLRFLALFPDLLH